MKKIIKKEGDSEVGYTKDCSLDKTYEVISSITKRPEGVVQGNDDGFGIVKVRSLFTGGKRYFKWQSSFIDDRSLKVYLDYLLDVGFEIREFDSLRELLNYKE